MKKIKFEKFFLIAGCLGIYLLATGLSYAAFNYARGQQPLKKADVQQTAEEDLLIDVSGPKTAECPLNGKFYTEKEKERWLGKRPLFVMIENHEEARPHSGLLKSDIIYEAVAEGGVTRFGAVYLCDAIAKETILGPIRSARTYFLDWASEYVNPLYVHVGGAHCDPQTGEGCQNGAKADALGQINTYGWGGENDLNQFSIGYPAFWRDYERIGHTVATEHTMYSTTEKLWTVGEDRGWTNLDPEGSDWIENYISWSFKDEEPTEKRGSVGKISFSFWQGYKAYDVVWEYDKDNNEYLRSNGGQPHLDLETKKPLTAKNIVVQFAKESPANDGYPGNIHLLYGTIGEGKALIFQDGEVIKAEWSKANRKSRTVFTTEAGKEIKFTRGRIWVEVLPTGNEVEY